MPGLPEQFFFRSTSRSLRLVAATMLLGLILTGCAARMSYHEGRELVAKGKVEEGLAKFEEALAQDPQAIPYRSAYVQTRDRAIASYIHQADRHAAAGNRTEAEQLYRRVLALSPNNERARTGLRNLEMDSRHDQLIEEAKTALGQDDSMAAKLKLSTILSENPNNQPARALHRTSVEKTAKQPAETVISAAYRKPITIEFKEAPLKQVFEVISRSSGLNFVFDKQVRIDRPMSVFLKNSTIEAAMHFTLLTNQLAQQPLNANTVLIYPNTAAKQRDYQEMVMKTFLLANADAKTVANTLKSMLKSRDVVIDEKLNMLIVRDSPEVIQLAEKLVALHDVPEPEVMLEVEVLEVKRARLQELGIKWPEALSLSPLGSGPAGAVTLNDLRNLSSRTTSATVPAVSFNARTQDSNANLLANPRIRARNREKAKILIGERVPNITTTATATGFVAESINYVDVGLTLNVEPNIYLDNDVAIKISLEVSNIVGQIKTQSGSLAYQIGTRNASTVLRLKDGENQVLAGLINDEERRSGSKIPGLGELPVVGRLFGSTADDNQKTEIVLSITPRIIRNIQRPEASLSEFRAGTDSSLRGHADASGEVDAGAAGAADAADASDTPESRPAGGTDGLPLSQPPSVPGSRGERGGYVNGAAASERYEEAAAAQEVNTRAVASRAQARPRIPLPITQVRIDGRPLRLAAPPLPKVLQ